VKLTHFSKLKHVANRLDAFEGLSLLAQHLETTEEVVDPDTLVFGSNGIFFIRPDGAIARVLFYRADKDVESEGFEDLLGTESHHDSFDLDEVVSSLDNYHMLECSDVVESAIAGWPGEYCVTQRPEGRFKYTYTRGADTLVEVDGQRLEPCPLCLQRLNARERKGAAFTAKSFLPRDYLRKNLSQNSTAPLQAEVVCKDVPDVLRADWQRIEHAFMQMCEYQCQGRDCPHSDLSAPEHRELIHAHYVQNDAQHEQFGVLKALCVHCHAKESGHEYIRKRVVTKHQLLCGFLRPAFKGKDLQRFRQQHNQ